MTNRPQALAIFRYQPHGHVPVVHFGYGRETLQNWVVEGCLREEDARGSGTGHAVDYALYAPAIASRTTATG